MTVNAKEPSSQPGRVSSTTSSSAARSAWSTAASISGNPLVRTRPIRPAADVAIANPGSSSSIPRARPAIEVAIGPIVSMLGASGQTPSNEIRPCVVFSPNTPQHAAGIRTEPPVSDPNATSASSVATATADPLEEPPGMSPGSSGLTGVPNHGLVPSGQHRELVEVRLADQPRVRRSAARQTRRVALRCLGS